MRQAILGAAALCVLALPLRADTVSVFAAASLKTALDGIAQDFKAQTGTDVVISYAGSNALAKQIIDGAPADIFISANSQWMEAVAAEGLISGNPLDLLGNSLVLVSHAPVAAPVQIDASFDLSARLGDGKLAMAMVDSVPAGQYGKAALESLGLWASVKTSVAQSENVRAALAFVASGEAPYGIVYASDAKADPKVFVVGSFPAESYPAITYPAALLSGAQDPSDRAFFAALTAPAATKRFVEAGFIPLAP